MKVNFKVCDDAVLNEAWKKEMGANEWMKISEVVFDKIESIYFYFQFMPSKGEVMCLFDWDDFHFKKQECRLVESHEFEVYDIWHFKDYSTIVLNTRKREE